MHLRPLGHATAGYLTAMANLTTAEAVARARRLADGPARRLVGIVGAPGAGKSTLASRMADAVGTPAVVVPMDGFHLPQGDLRRLGRRERMGAIDTFDAKAYRAVLQRLRDDDGQEFAPGFDRSVEEPVPRAIPVPAPCRLVITEGNYLLDDEPPWPAIRALLDEVWFLELDSRERLERLIARHIEFGKTPAQAAAWVRDVDEPNAARVLERRDAADFVVSIRPSGYSTTGDA